MSEEVNSMVLTAVVTLHKPLSQAINDKIKSEESVIEELKSCVAKNIVHPFYHPEQWVILTEMPRNKGANTKINRVLVHQQAVNKLEARKINSKL